MRDDKLNPGEAATRALELIENEKVNFIVGSLSAAVQLAVNNVTKERGIIFNSISQSDAINEAADFSKYTFHEALNPHMTAGAVGRYVFPKFGKKVVFLTADYAYGHEMVRGFQRGRQGRSASRRSAISATPSATTDFSTLLPRIQAMKPDVLCITNFGRDQQIALKQATDFGLKKSIKIVAPILLYHRPPRGRSAGIRTASSAARRITGASRTRCRPPRPSTTASARCTAARSRPITARWAMPA